MDIEHLEGAIDRYGGDLRHWPAAERTAAERLVASDPRAARLVAAGERLDRALGEAMTPMPVDSALIGRIVAGLGTGLHHDVTIRPTRRLIAWAGAAMVAFLVTGYAAGLALPASQGEDAFAGLLFGDSGTTTDGGTTTTDSGGVL